jgi:hypothetical protein
MSASGTFATFRRTLKMSAYRGRPEAIGTHSETHLTLTGHLTEAISGHGRATQRMQLHHQKSLTEQLQPAMD